MRNIPGKINEYQHIYSASNFNENDFVKMLLVLLFKMGVKRINENELKEN